MKKILRIFKTGLIAAVMVVGFGGVALAEDPPAPALSGNQNDICNGIKATDPNAQGCNDASAGESKITGIIRTVINVLSFLVGGISVIMIIVGGFRYLISGGDSNAIASAKNTIIYAIVGLMIALLAQALVRFVFTKTTTAK